MTTGWIESSNNWRCQTCEARLVQAGRITLHPGGPRISGRPIPVYCPVGHDIRASSSDELDTFRDSRGYRQDDVSLREMPKPPKAP